MAITYGYVSKSGMLDDKKVVHKFTGNPSKEELVLTLSNGKTAITILCRPGWQFEEGVFKIDDEGQKVTCKRCLAILKKEGKI